jgi:capsular exopolysaccharide synthesis family protein
LRVDNATVGASPFDSVETVNRFKGYLAALRRRWFLVAIPMVLGAALGWLSTPEAPTVPGVPGASIVAGPTYYRAAHVLIDEGQGSDSGASNPVNLPQAAYLVNTGEVPKRVADKLGLSIDEVATSVIGLPRAQVSSVEVQAVGKDKDEVVKMADTAAAELLTVLQAKAKSDADAERDRIIAQIDKLDGQISALNSQIAANPPNVDQLEAQQRSLTNQYSLVYEQFSQLADRPAPTAGLTSLEGAKPVKITKAEYERTKDTIREGADYVTGATPTTTAPSDRGDSLAPSPGAGAATRAAFGGVVGLGLGVGFVLLLDRFDSRLRRRTDVETVTGLAVLAEIPPLTRHQQNDREVIAHTQHRSRAAEAYRVIRGAMLFDLSARDQTKRSDGATVVMVTSSNPAEGKTTTVANLAAVLAEGGFKVLVINCDFRRPQVHRYLLADPDQNEASAEIARVGSVTVTNTIIDRVRLVSGLGENDPDANPLDVLALQRKVIEATRSSFDMILLDTAPLLTTNDASELLSETDQVLLVVRAGKTKVEAARRVTEVLTRFNAPVLGVVMNDSTEAQTAQYYYGIYTSKGANKPNAVDTATPGGQTNGFGPPNAASQVESRSPEIGSRP